MMSAIDIGILAIKALHTKPGLLSMVLKFSSQLWLHLTNCKKDKSIEPIFVPQKLSSFSCGQFAFTTATRQQLVAFVFLR